LLRQDNADRRLTPQADELGLITTARRQRLREKLAEMEKSNVLLKSSRIEKTPGDVYLRRPEIGWPEMCELVPELRSISSEAANQCLTDIKYAGYIDRQRMEVDKQHRLAEKRIPISFDYEKIGALRNEAREKLTRVRPLNLAQAKRISGITPADIALVMAHLGH